MKEKGVWLVATYGILLRLRENSKDDEFRKKISEVIQDKQKMLQIAREVGVKIAAGYDPAETEMHGTNACEIVALTMAGFTNLESIRAATMNGAEL